MALSYTGVNSDSQDQASKIGNPIIYNIPAPASYTGAQTYTMSDLLGGTIVHDATGGVTATLPTAALLVSAIPSCRVGDSFWCLIINGAASSGTLTLAAGSGGSFDANQGAGSRIVQFGTSKDVQIRVTNTTVGSQAYVVYS